MAWETRKHSQKQYYTRSWRINGQIQRDFGCGVGVSPGYPHSYTGFRAQYTAGLGGASQREARHSTRDLRHVRLLSSR
jgi:hypothetical protein